MARNIDRLPDYPTLWRGTMLAMLTHSISTARFPDFRHEQTMDGTNYCVRNGQSMNGTIAFSETALVAVFFETNSERSPFRRHIHYDVDRYFEGMPSNLQSLAYGQALQYMIEEYHGKPIPVITTAFWADRTNGPVESADDWDSVIAHGGALIRNHILEPKEAIECWTEELDLVDDEIELIQRLFVRRMDNAHAPITLSEEDRRVLERTACDTTGLEAAREKLLELNIIL